MKHFGKGPLPRFRDCARSGTCQDKRGLSLYYSYQCPFTEHYASEMERVAVEQGIPCTKHLVDSEKAARNQPSPFGVFSAFYEGTFLTHEVMSPKKFAKLLKEHRGQARAANVHQ